MPSLNLDLDIEQHPKMRRLMRAVGDDALLYVVRLWVYCAKFHTATGKLDGYTDEDIHRAVNWTRSDLNLADQLRFCGFIRQGKKGPYIHDWIDHAGHLSALKKRAQSAAKARWKKYAASNPTSNAPSNPLTNPSYPAKHSSLRQASRSVHSSVVRSEDKTTKGFEGIDPTFLAQVKAWPKEIP